ncbi:hypothetical protein ACT6NV_06850 [Robiginitalea sp. IMCC44478]|uniref:hypothetical protein n=1 Tax=Robiginitalea sp. IMCC44478 TaxID=3459122 RepID=UPI0040420AA9
MRKPLQLLSFTAALLYSCTQVLAQGIEIDELLQDTAPEWNVKIGAAWPGKISKYRFGDYAVADSKQGMATSTYTQKPFSRKASSRAEVAFTFALSNGENDSVFVRAASRSSMEELRASQIFEWLSIGEEGLQSATDYFEARMSLDNGAPPGWLLLLVRSWREDYGEEIISEMSNGEQTIQIVPVSSPSNGKGSRNITAMGYEFFSKGESLAAVQYYGGGAFGLNKNKVWLRPDLGAELRLVLAGAMTALMEYELQQGFFN